MDTWVRFLGWEDPLEESMVTHPSILAWRTPWTEDPGGPQKVGHDWETNAFTTHEGGISYAYFHQYIVRV